MIILDEPYASVPLLDWMEACLLYTSDAADD